ncbi:protein starmaker [Halyomorpha halys]|uniref:protein starmaker n=1 Tax=Halyomorpha halys TaxID=286706 RepID=UPI0006D4DE02|nr:dentin sialophosphoprotein [Halyomorpha halys]XP_014287890.1 dentin sialophosphoprotein [Halyomorpha halys]
MELKTPTKKGIKTPRYRPPLPMLNESCSGLCIDEYDWPLFTGYYNGTSVIVDDSQAMTLLTNKGFFGKGSLSRGCPNLAKRKIPISVVYESQWKRRKTWIESLNTFLESKKKSNETLEGNINEGSSNVKKMEIDNEENCPPENNSSNTELKSASANDNSKNKSNETTKDNIVEIESKESSVVEKKENDNEENSTLQNNSCKSKEEEPYKTNGNEINKNNSNETSQENVVDSDSKKSNGVEEMEVDNEKKPLEPSETSRYEENKNNTNETSQDNKVEVDIKKSNVLEIIEIDNEKTDSLNSSSKNEDAPSKTSGNEESKNDSNETSQDNKVDIDIKQSNVIEIIEMDNEKSDSLNNSCKNEDAPSKTSGNEECKNDSNETSQDNLVGSDNKESNDDKNNSCETEEEASKISGDKDYKESKTNSNETSQENMVDVDNDKEKTEIDKDKNNSCKTEEEASKIIGDEDNKESKTNSNETSQENMVDVDNDKEKTEVDKDKNNSCKSEEEPSGGNKDGKVSLDTDNDLQLMVEESEDKKVISDSGKNEESINISVQNIQNKNNLKADDKYEAIEESTSSKAVVSQSKCVRKINLSNNTEKGTLNINEVLVIPDTDGEIEQYFLNLKPRIEEEKVKTAVEVLYLSLEEAFFLSYSCNCLQIYDLTSNILQIRDMWVLFQESQPDFIEKYVAYHYFRAKGWVVKSGTKFGGDFMLYKKGPLYFHASYIVIVEVLKNDKSSSNKTTWQKIVGMNRMAESANKEILICHVLWPDVEEKKFNEPGILKEFKVSEILLRRWQATHEKTP